MQEPQHAHSPKRVPIPTTPICSLTNSPHRQPRWLRGSCVGEHIQSPHEFVLYALTRHVHIHTSKVVSSTPDLLFHGHTPPTPPTRVYTHVCKNRCLQTRTRAQTHVPRLLTRYNCKHAHARKRTCAHLFNDITHLHLPRAQANTPSQPETLTTSRVTNAKHE